MGLFLHLTFETKFARKAVCFKRQMTLPFALPAIKKALISYL